MAKEFNLSHYLENVRPRLQMSKSKNKDGKITFKDLDGNLIMSRSSDTSFWDASFLTIALESDARMKGVKIVSVDSVSPTAINCTVDYLRKGRK